MGKGRKTIKNKKATKIKLRRCKLIVHYLFSKTNYCHPMMQGKKKR
jgi:hypothetical protein